MTNSTLPAGLMLVHGNHPESLRDLLVAWMTRYPLAPLENEVILVQSNGIAQWLKLALAEDATPAGGGGCGIAAALEVSLPARFLWRAYRAVLGCAAVPETSPFDEARLVWRLMRLLPTLLSAPLFAPLQRFLQQDEDLRKRFQLAQRLADLFDQYQVYRADWLAAWAAGTDLLIGARGERRSLPEDQRWQAALWRALVADVADRAGEDGGQGKAMGRAAVHEAFMARAGAWQGEAPAGLPRRVIVFGISALPRQSLEALAALAHWCQVLMCVHNPCQHYWADIIADKDLLRAGQARQSRRHGMPPSLSEDSLHLHAHPLLAAWGKQGRDFIGLLDEHDSAPDRAHYQPYFAALARRIDLFSTHGEASLLNQLQEDIRDLRPLHETRARWAPVDTARDRSVRFHVTHGPQREVEILHDQLLAAFDADPSLRPREVIVMVPDIDAYAPHIQAVFGLLDAQDPRYIPFSVADQGRRRVDPLLGAVASLLALPQSRLAVSEVLDLLEVPALRQRFGIAGEDLPLLQRWIRRANIRWGLHPEHRSSLGLPPDAAQNSWSFGLRRLLFGYAVGADARPWQEIEACDEIGGLDAALLGPLVQLVDALDAAWRTLREPATVVEWCARLRGLLADFFTASDGGEAYTLQQLDDALQRWQEECAEAGLAEPLPLSVVGEHWLAQIEAGGLTQRFFAGAVTFATLMPMRAIPFRHVCLLGMNDGDYPRARVPFDFDLMGRDYRPGDRSRREDDRYLFLEALLSARDALHVSWVGRSIHDNTERPPSVLVGQLRDHLAAGWGLAGFAGEDAESGEALLAALTVEHPLQAFSDDYFPPRPEASTLFTYAREWRERPPADGGPGALQLAPRLAPVQREEPLTLRELADFLRDPVKTFLRRRLGVVFETEDVASEDQEPFAPDGLLTWQLQDELIQAQLAALGRGESAAEACAQGIARLRRRGELAAGGFGAVVAEELSAPMADLFERYAAALARWPEAVPAEVELRLQTECDGQVVEVADWLGGIRTDASGARGRVVLDSRDVVKDGKYRPDRVIRHWVAHLAAHLAGGPLTTHILSKVGEVELPPLPVAEAQTLLAGVLAAWREGMCRPLPLAVRSGFVFLEQGEERAGKTYEGDANQLGEVASSPYLQRAYPDFAALSASGEFARLAADLLGPLLRLIHAKGGAGQAAAGASA